MTVEIKNENLLVSVEVPEEVDGQSFSDSVLIAAFRAVEHACPAMDLTETYCHVDPDNFSVRDDSDPKWQAFKRFNLCYHYHLKVPEEWHR